MKTTQKKLPEERLQFVSKITYDKRLDELRKHLLPAAKYVELNKQVANMVLPNV